MAANTLNKKYKVQELINHRINPETKQLEFYAKWVGWAHKFNTWEPESHFEECPEVIKEYWERKKKSLRKNKKGKNFAGVKANVQLKNIVKKQKKTKKIITNGSGASDELVNQVLIDSTNQKPKKETTIGRKEAKRCRVSESESLNRPYSPHNRCKSSSVQPLVSRKSSPERPNINGFERGWTVEDIIGATDESGEMEFLIKWKDHDEEELVPAKHVREVVPQMVIQFYERHTRWEEEPQEDTSEQ